MPAMKFENCPSYELCSGSEPLPHPQSQADIKYSDRRSRGKQLQQLPGLQLESKAGELFSRAHVMDNASRSFCAALLDKATSMVATVGNASLPALTIYFSILTRDR